MLPNHASLNQIRYSLLQALRLKYPEGESASIMRLILEHAGYPSPSYLVEPDQVPGPAVVAQINEIVSEIHRGNPIQYVLGYTYFCDLRIKVNDNVLIPRPETEEMVQRIIDGCDRNRLRILDIGTGSGCIALALKNHFRYSNVTATDKDPEALELASENGRINGLRVNWVLHDILDHRGWHTSERFDLIVSNPPYVLEKEKNEMPENVLGFEPHRALFVSDSDPFPYVRAIGSFCSARLAENGSLWLEINERLGPESASVLTEAGFTDLHIINDLHEKARYIRASR